MRYLVGGDFNDNPRSSAIRRFEKRGELEIGLCYRLRIAGDTSGHYYKREASYTLVDGFVVSSELMPDVAGQRGQIFDWPKGKQGSDHRMVFFDLEFSESR